MDDEHNNCSKSKSQRTFVAATQLTAWQGYHEYSFLQLFDLLIGALFIPNLIVFINNNKKQVSLIHQGGKQLEGTHRKAFLEWYLVVGHSSEHKALLRYYFLEKKECQTKV